ncbi:P-loop containing nucleoside triphosphate hydrolase protein [Obelidium mucronatum]|nr:P-loop containing nucleoside triphosphate hydrolase protein [Obelidium mucronatum]
MEKGRETTISEPHLASVEADASFWSKLTFSWFNPLARKGFKTPLEMDDMYCIDDSMKSELLVLRFETLLAQANANCAGDPSRERHTVRNTVLSMYRAYPLWGIGKIIGDLCLNFTSIVMRALLTTIVAAQGPDPPPVYQAFLYAVGFFLLMSTSLTLSATVFHHSYRLAIGVKGMLTAAVYRKSLRLNGVGRARFSAGKLTNLVSTDSIEGAFQQFQMVWTAPFYFITTITILMVIIGATGLAGVAFLIICVPFQSYMIKRLMVLRGLTAPITDNRIKLSSEILQGIRIIKYFSWETQFMKKVSDIRKDEELILVRNAAFIRSIIQCLGFAIPALAASITFLVYGALNDNLGPVQIFSSLALFSQELFDAPEVDFQASVDRTAPFGVEIKDGEFVWDSDSPEVAEETTKQFITSDEVLLTPTIKPAATLRNINLQCPSGGLTSIVGAVGSGKSSLLSSLIAELKCNKGTVTFNGKVGYCSQQAWIVNATVRDNIVFGRPFDEKRYTKVVEAACLLQDFKILPNGDLSEIGERGINLSGGQKQRISLARLMYTDHDIALLDDPLSAVDSHVGRKIFEEGICGILAAKTRLLVTHQLHHVPASDWVVLIKNGEIAEQGKYADLISSNGDFAQLMAAYGGETGEEEEVDTPLEKGESSATLFHTDDKNLEKESDSPLVVTANNPQDTITQMQTETRQSGHISTAVFMSYFKSTGSNLFLIGTLFTLLFTQVARLANDIWLVEWTQFAYPALSKEGYMLIYAGLTVLQSLSLLSYSLLFAIGGIESSKRLHDAVFSRIMKCSVGFFDQTPIGRIINRLSRDVDYVDNSIYDAMRLFFYGMLQIISSVSLVAYVTGGTFLAALVPIVGLYVGIQIFYRRTSRELKRIESISRSPLYAHISECMSGLSTIRAYNDEARFIEKTHALVDANSSPLYMLYTGQRWIQFRLDSMGNVLVLAASLYAAASQKTVNASQIGLALSYLLQCTSLLNMTVFHLVEVEMQLNAVERLVEYIELPIEDQGGEEPPKEWPVKGDIEFKDVQMRYQPNLPLVLKGVNVVIRGGEKIGVVGRTGSGKSSLMQALFRIVDLAGGQILIDGVDTSKLRLHNLRTALAIIPQDPVLFSGSLRSNLDPSNRFSDNEIWGVLERCGMKDAISEMEGKLECKLVENAENVSVGQRQLLCLARACLQRPRIIVLDECTASVDMATDALIQKTIQEEFKDATTLTIAHRLNTIIGSTKILVLGEGHVLEYDTPRRLLIEKRDSHFSQMVDETGDANASLLQISHKTAEFVAAKFEPTSTNMQNISQPHLPSLEAQSSFLSQLTNAWFDKLVKKGWKAPLEMEDLYAIDDSQRSLLLVEQFEALLAQANEKASADTSQPPGKRKTVTKALTAMYAYYPLWGIVKIIGDAFMPLTSLFMRGLLTVIVDSQGPNPPPAPSAVIFQRSSKVAIGVKGMLISALYRKSLRLNGVGRSLFSSGKLTNLVSTDISRIEQTFQQFQMVWTAPIYFLTTIAILMVIIGAPGLAGAAFLIACLPLQGYMIKKLMVLRGLIAPTTDKRIKLSSEILQGIRIIKYFCWETQFIKNVSKIREQEELVLVRNAAFIRSVITCLGFAIPAFAASITFLVYGALHDDLGPIQIFSSLALFNQLRQHVMWLPLYLSNIGDCFISLHRLQELFDAPEVEFTATIDPTAAFGVQISNAEFLWESTTTASEPNSEFIASEVDSPLPYPKSTLKDITINCPIGGLTSIVGAVGSGKSSLLSSLIGELKCVQGTVTFNGKIGYCAQQAWIVNATVRENIVFGREFDSGRYHAVVEAACLQQDFKILPNGDLSEIGERGINLSGGQKQRIALARLMYTDHDIALLDDPLSAVDSHVGRKIFEEGICGILAAKTRLLVTHQLHHIPASDWVVFLKNGEIAEQGKYTDLIAANGEFAQLMAAYGGETGEDETPVEAVESSKTLAKTDENTKRITSKENASTGESGEPVKHVTQMQAEVRQSGKISSSVFMSYFKSSGSNAFLLVTVASLLFAQASRLANDIWLVEWTQFAYPGLSKEGYMLTYAGLTVLQALSLLAYSLLFAVGGIQASKSLHDAVFSRILKYPIAFFDQTPIGRIINRLSRDIDQVDNSIYDAMRLLFYAILQVISTFALVSYITSGVFVAALIPMVALYVGIQIVYRATSRELKRIESISRSPLYAHISECMSGLSTIRAYNDEARFIQKTHLLTDANMSPMYLLFTGQRWIQFRLECIGHVLVLCAALYAAASRFIINASKIGLALSYLLQSTALLNMTVFHLVEVEMQLNAVERLVEYIELPIEDQGGDEPPKEWPVKGDIEFKDVQMRYQPNLPLVLKGVNVAIRGGEKIGVVGRTGSGKSSLMQALFRIVDFAGGQILIDGVDTSKLRLHNLRMALAIIPQDPVLFSGSLRSNLDPSNRFSDNEIWGVLERCGMKDAISEMEGKLECKLVENAENVSVGQRQLLCLARACLQRPRIIVLDECTASVDMATDALIQKTIQEEFKDATTLTIAHRLNTIIGSTKILVLGDGQVLEYDTPRHLLIEKRDSHFGQMVDETGDANASMLRSFFE